MRRAKRNKAKPAFCQRRIIETQNQSGSVFNERQGIAYEVIGNCDFRFAVQPSDQLLLKSLVFRQDKRVFQQTLTADALILRKRMPGGEEYTPAFPPIDFQLMIPFQIP